MANQLSASDVERQRDKYLATDAAIKRLERYLADPANWPVKYPVTIRGTIQRLHEAEAERDAANEALTNALRHNAQLERVRDAALSHRHLPGQTIPCPICRAIVALDEPRLTESPPTPKAG